LAETVNDVKRSVEAIAEDLFNAENDARLAAEVAGREAANRPDEGTPEELAAHLLAEEALAEAEDHAGREAGPETSDQVSEAGSTGDGGSADEPAASDEPTDEKGDAVAAPPVEQVDALFAKLRAAQGDPEDAASDATPSATTDGSDAGDGDDGEDGPPPAANPLAVRRDELVAPIITGLSRRLKRSFQDEQNDLLDRLRANGSTWSSDLLPEETEHLDSIVTAALPFLEEGADAGASFLGSDDERPKVDTLVGLAHELAESVVGPLRKRLIDSEGLEGAEEAVVTEHVGSAFREWKGERVERLAGDHVVAAFSLGSLAVAGSSSTGVEWVAIAAPDESPCPDCEDNGLNGAQGAGEEFPTGHTHPPAHPGCRCLLAPSTP